MVVTSIDHNSNQPADPAVPPRLQAELSRLAGTPSGLDSFNAASAAGAHFARVRRARRLRWASAAAAACITIAGGAIILPSFLGHARSSPSIASHTTLRGDLNADGKVDLLDALLLANTVEHGKAPSSWDFNNDAQVDRKDADVIAQAAVSLSGGRL